MWAVSSPWQSTEQGLVPCSDTIVLHCDGWTDCRSSVERVMVKKRMYGTLDRNLKKAGRKRGVLILVDSERHEFDRWGQSK